MKIEKINDHQIRCTLTSEDLAIRNIKLSELAYGSEKARSLFRDMMQQAAMDFGFEADDIPLMIEAVPLSSEKIVLIITKVDSPDELDTRFSNFTQYEGEEDAEDMFMENPDLSDFLPDVEDASSLFQLLQQMKKEKPDSKSDASMDSQQTLPADMVRIFSCQDLDSAIEAAHALHGFYQGKNTLYKDSREHLYHLVVHQSQHDSSEFNRVINMLSSYLKPGRSTAGIQAYFEEHFHKIIKGNALQQLGEIS